MPRLQTLSIIAIVLTGVWSVPTRAATTEPATAQSAPAESREHFVKGMTGTVLATVHDSQKSFAEKQSILVKTFNDMVDTGWIARFVLGKTWNSATDEQKAQYTTLYRAYLTKSYVSNFDEETEGKLEDIKILGISDTDDDRFVVRTEMALQGSNPVRVDYLLRDDSGSYKVIDIVVEGVSLLATHRSQFTEIAGNGGMNGVISKLQQMAANHPSSAH